MSALAAAARRAGQLLIEPAPADRPAPSLPLDVAVAALSAGAGATTVVRGLALALGRDRAVELAPAGAPAVAAGPGAAVVRDTVPGEPGSAVHPGPGRVLVAVADGRREPALAALVTTMLARHHERVVLVANRARDPDAWAAAGAVCVPDSWLGALLVARGRLPRGGMGTALAGLAARVEQVTAPD